MDEIIKELIDEIVGVMWSPGAYPASLRDIRTQKIGNWTCTAVDQVTTTEVTVTATLWAGTPDDRALAVEATRAVFLNYGFEERSPASTEMPLPNGEAACMTTLTFHGYIDKKTYWVYKNN